ncbi:MAG TPA: hypothetical protein ENJ01_06880 [Gammaproteobacteria bacterium]|nr:hypothetical protein [Gammaproteobacteria bacterium]
MTHRKRHRRIKLRSLYNWHRYIGLLTALFVLLLSVTGMMLNHTESLRLDEKRVQSDWLLDWYGIESPRQLRSFRAGEVWITQAEEHLFIGSQATDSRMPGHLAGALASTDLLVIATENDILLYTHDGEFIEHLTGTHGVPAGITRLGSTGDGLLCVRTAQGSYITDSDFNQWRRNDCNGVRWTSPAPAPELLAASIRHRYRSSQVNWERVTLDLHSGRLFGEGGVLLMDAAALLFAFLAVSGILLWGIRLLKQRQHRRYRHGRH